MTDRAEDAREPVSDAYKLGPVEARSFPGWRTIDSAPKDGTRVLLFTRWSGDEITEPFDEIQIGCWDEGTTDQYFYRKAGWDTEKIGYAIAWQPLPTPPDLPHEEGK